MGAGMITRPTVLVLGAGASVDYNFPKGSELLLKICKEGRRVGVMRDYLVQHMKLDPVRIEKFADVLENRLHHRWTVFSKRIGNLRTSGNLLLRQL
jgi:hypothetical protein